MEGFAADNPRSVTVLGSTGSIGQSTLDLIERTPGAYHVEALTGGRNVARLIQQARRVKPRLAVIDDDTAYTELKDGLAGTGIDVAAGRDAIVAASARPVDWVMAGIVGIAGLQATLEAIRNAKIVAIANKECLVCAGPIIMHEAERHDTVILPADSEHNAVYQLLGDRDRSHVSNITLTASGGPFRTMSLEEMKGATLDAALAHPTWKMGNKITIDSATMMNKGLELIEARYLFAMPEDRIDVLVHPQSIVHAMVSFVDGSVFAHLGTPDMRIPISHTLGWPDRLPTSGEKLDLGRIGSLDFEAPDPVRFPALRLAREALHEGGAAPISLNAANEEAVASFLSGKIRFLDVARLVEETLNRMEGGQPGTIDEVVAVDGEARHCTRNLIADGTRS